MMKNRRLLAMLIIAAFLTVSEMDYTDEQVNIAHCEQMKEQGVWPKGYQCE